MSGGFENSAEYQAALKLFQTRQISQEAAKQFKESALKAYTGNAIAMNRSVRSAVRGVKEAVSNFVNNIKNKAVDKAADARKGIKGFFNKVAKSLSSAKDTAHYGLLVAKEKIGKVFTDKLDTAHYGLLVAKDGATKALQPVKIVGKAAAHTFAIAAGATLGGAVIAGKAMANGAKTAGAYVADKAQTAGKAVKAVALDQAKKFKETANKVVLGGKTLAGNLFKRIRNGGTKAIESVGATLTAAKSSVQLGMQQAKVAVKARAQDNTKDWFLKGMEAARAGR